MLESLRQPDGRIRRDDEAVAAFVAAARADSVLGDLVERIESAPLAIGTDGVLLRGTLRARGRSVVVKLNAQPGERAWLPAVGAVDHGIVPAVFGSGDRVDVLELPWLCMEHLPTQPPGFAGPEWYDSLMAATVRWHAAAAHVALPPAVEIDVEWVRFWLDAGLDLDPSDDLRRLRDRLDEDWAVVSSMCDVAIAHGDVHFFNAGSRDSGAPEELVLFDPHAWRAPWPFDGAYCETLTHLGLKPGHGAPLVERMARLRRDCDLPTPDPPDVDRVSRLMCAWLAVMWRALFRES
ncbi:MAG: hypothetical protein V7636_2287, partial [Actinomycetota bacterium]